MGWLFSSSLDGHSRPRELLDSKFAQEPRERRCRVLRSALAGVPIYYAAVEITRPDRPRESCAVVCLVKYNPRDREGSGFGHTDMDETMGPYERTCPAAIFDLLTPTENAHALEWRSKCRAALERRAAKPKLRHSAAVVSAEPIALGDGHSFARLTVDVDPRRPRTLRFRTPESGVLFRISRLKDRAWRVED